MGDNIKISFPPWASLSIKSFCIIIYNYFPCFSNPSLILLTSLFNAHNSKTTLIKYHYCIPSSLLIFYFLPFKILGGKGSKKKFTRNSSLKMKLRGSSLCVRVFPNKMPPHSSLCSHNPHTFLSSSPKKHREKESSFLHIKITEIEIAKTK